MLMMLRMMMKNQRVCTWLYKSGAQKSAPDI